MLIWWQWWSMLIPDDIDCNRCWFWWYWLQSMLICMTMAMSIDVADLMMTMAIDVDLMTHENDRCWSNQWPSIDVRLVFFIAMLPIVREDRTQHHFIDCFFMCYPVAPKEIGASDTRYTMIEALYTWYRSSSFWPKTIWAMPPQHGKKGWWLIFGAPHTRAHSSVVVLIVDEAWESESSLQ